jgi:quercetin dioxygenase-like cupin family protein
MRIFRGAEAPSGPGDPKTFTGPVRTTRLAADDTATPVHVYRVEFDAGARTNWHVHSGPQWLFIVEGRVRVQVLGQPAQDVSAGDAVVFAPGERHWHGAAPGAARGAHLAVNVNLTTEWLEPVSDADYQR